MCKECTAQKREAGTPYRCTQCGLWYAACHFATKHQNPRWTMSRICMSCDAKKQCLLCGTKYTKEHFSAAAWGTRKPKRRVCLQCQTKTSGFWTCAACRQRRPRKHFSKFIAKRPSGENGTQTCDACHAAIVQRRLRKRAATSSLTRLEPLRKKLRRTQVLRETWEAIGQYRSTRMSNPTANQNKDGNNMSAPVAQTMQAEQQQYTCPLCQGLVHTSLVSGRINHRRICGKQFRVHNGLIQPTRSTVRYSHSCPTCGTCVQSAKASGRINSKHKQPDGRTCRQTRWQSG